MTDYPLAQDIMNNSLPRLKPEDDLYKAIGILMLENMSAAPVINERDEIQGMLSEKGCMKVLSQDFFYHSPGGEKVKDFMTPVKESVTPNTDIFKVAEIFMKGNVRILPVLDGKKLVGQIRRSEVLKKILNTSVKHQKGAKVI